MVHDFKIPTLFKNDNNNDDYGDEDIEYDNVNELPEIIK